MKIFNQTQYDEWESKLEEMSGRYSISQSNTPEEMVDRLRKVAAQKTINEHKRTLQKLIEKSISIPFTSYRYSSIPRTEITKIEAYISRVEKIESEQGKGSYAGTNLTREEKEDYRNKHHQPN